MVDSYKSKKVISGIINFLIKLFVELVDVMIKVFLIIGSCASVILLFKMFPETALTFYSSLAPILKIFVLFFKILFVLLFTFLILNLVGLIVEAFDKVEKQHKIKREKFMKELINRIKKEINKK